MAAKTTGRAPAGAAAGSPTKLSGKVYEKELRRLQTELCLAQDWVKATRQRIVIIFEGRDAAGKGGIIRAITERCSPRVFRIVALPAPSDREKTQMHIQRYLPHFPAAGEVIIFDRSYYNRAGIEKVLGFCTEEQHREFLNLCPAFEKIMTDNGIRLIKYWLEVKEEEQARRFEARIEDPLRQWKLSPTDLEFTPALVRLFPRPRPDAGRDRYALGAVAHRPLGFEEECPTQLHQASPESAALREGRAAQGKAAEALDEACL